MFKTAKTAWQINILHTKMLTFRFSEIQGQVDCNHIPDDLLGL